MGGKQIYSNDVTAIDSFRKSIERKSKFSKRPPEMNRTKIISVPFERNNEMKGEKKNWKRTRLHVLGRELDARNTGVNSRGTLMGHGNTSPMVSRGPSLILE